MRPAPSQENVRKWQAALVDIFPTLFYNGAKKEASAMRLGNNLFKARKKSGLSQEDVAAKLGVSRQTISKWELEVSHS